MWLIYRMRICQRPPCSSRIAPHFAPLGGLQVAACKALAEPHLEGSALMAGMAKAAGVFYNFTHDMPCFDFKVGANKETDEDSGAPSAEEWDFD